MRILGLDLGTNSIGWALRENDKTSREEYSQQYKQNSLDLTNEIIDYGVVVFEKGVGEGKSGEFSLAAERRQNRSKRRLYNAKRYRKWALLKLLIENNMCPLTKDELKQWSIGQWEQKDGKWKNTGRQYPKSVDFKRWLAMDFDKIGLPEQENEKLKPEFKNPYELRKFLLETPAENTPKRKFQIGRALYHLAQRRGFKTSRKSGKSNYAPNQEIEIKKQQDPNYHITSYALEKINSDNRFRASGVIQRKYYEEEFLDICEKQEISDTLTKQLFDAVYYVRPLRSQKNLVGKCTLEKNKTRIPISHPLYEEFRALQFINNIKWKEKNSQNKFEPIPITVKKKIFEEIFFKKETKGKNKGKIRDDDFKFKEISDAFSENGKYEFNFKDNTNISACSVIAGLMNTFSEEWKDVFISDENKFGINWNNLKLEYSIQYVGKNGKGLKRKGKNFIEKNIGEKRILNYENIWHLLFDYKQTKDNEDGLKQFCINVLNWNDEKINQFISIDIAQGYGSLSRNAISKIIPYLQEGYIYKDAVLFANLEKVLGEKVFKNNKDKIKKRISETIKEINQQKEKLNIVNALIQQYFSDENMPLNRPKGVDEMLKKLAEQETERKIKAHLGIKKWTNLSENDKNDYKNFVLEKYLSFLNGDQSPEEKASALNGKSPTLDYYKLPRLDEAIKKILKEEFNATDKGLKYLYHPSDIEIYSKSKTEKEAVDPITEEVIKVPQLESPIPPSKAWKNPMAMRTMHELRHLLNYLLRIRKIDTETKIVIEIARELNDANKRWAYETYQRNREEENKEFAKAIYGIVKEKYPNINENDTENINKVRLWWEQIPDGAKIYDEIKKLKEDVDKYRLWKEQKAICIYTGKTISLTDLFDGTKIQFAHTLPRSKSFDNSLANLTVAYAYFNTNIQKEKLPTQLENYETDWTDPLSGETYTAIKPRLEDWKRKRDELEKRIEENKKETKKANIKGDVERKNLLIKQRHILTFEYEYWKKKIEAFELSEVPEKWKNSQLVDTQIITKYTRAYLESLFNKVEVQKASVVNDFKKIYQIKGDEQKDRSRHSHHATDAAVLTLIPGSSRREAILKKYYQSLDEKEQGKSSETYHTIPYSAFHIEHILNIDKSVIINHINRDKTFVQTKKKIHKGKQTLIIQGDTVRGKLHAETYLGVIKLPDRDENGNLKIENGKILIKKDRNGQEEKWVVVRKLIGELKIEDFDKKDFIVDEFLRKHIKKQLDNGIPLEHVTDFQGKRIRHIRCRCRAGRGYLSLEKAIPIRKNIQQSTQEYKQYVYGVNEENYLYLLYEEITTSKKANVLKREAQIINLFEATKLKKEYGSIKNAIKQKYATYKGLQLKAVLKVGQKVIFYSENKEELKNLSKEELQNRLFRVYKFNEVGSPYIYLQNCIEARSEQELAQIPKSDKLGKPIDGYTEFNSSLYQHRLRLKADKLNCVFENKDFYILPDGEIKWKF
ncbi:MAG: hypothetical protein K6T34_09380 [Thermoflavifilum sp.]|nr:hypothetical protein [Thermoflavifilum sp.]